MCQKIEHHILPFRACDLLDVEDRVEGEKIGGLPQDVILKAGKSCEETGVAFTLFCESSIVACGGMKRIEGETAWLVWTIVSSLAETHKKLLHKTMKGLLKWLMAGSRGMPIICTVNETVDRNVRYAQALGFRRYGESEMVVGGEVHGLYRLEVA